MLGLAVALTVVFRPDGDQSSASAPDRHRTVAAPVAHGPGVVRRIGCNSNAQLRGAAVPEHDASRDQLSRFDAVVAVSCVWAERRYADGLWRVELRRVANAPLAKLVDALDRPDGHVPPGTACAAYASIPPQLVLVDRAGRVLRPRFPVDGCGHATTRASKAFDGLDWRVTSVRKISLDIPNDPVLRTCETGWKDEINEPESHPDYSGGPVGLDGASIACVYRRNGDPLVGKYERGMRLTATETRALDDATDLPGLQSSTCTPPARFAVVHTGGKLTYLELGGCYRALHPDSTLGRADPGDVQRLLDR